jgi:putative salt-induced outer membrane protein YdiY
MPEFAAMMRRCACPIIWAVGFFFVSAIVQAQPLLSPPDASSIGAPSLGASSQVVEDFTSAETLPLPADAPMLAPGGALLPELQALAPADDPGWNLPTHWIDSTLWETSIQFGLNGSSGTSESLSIQTGASVERETKLAKLDLDAKYNRTTKGGAATQNNAELNGRNDWVLHEWSPWTLYGTGDMFYDAFKAFDLQVSANTGVGYRFFHEPTLELIGRFGGGASREFGGPDDRWVPESLFGLKYMQRLSALQKLTAKVDYYPEWTEVGEFRLLADIGWETALVQPSNMSLKVSASDRYDSTPSGADPHLVNYSVLLMIKM